MAFSEKTKLIAKQKACFHCVICHREFVEVHHIIPQSEGGSDNLVNAAPLCARCHDLYGSNPEKRKQIREMRDHWFEQMEMRANGKLNILDTFKIQSDESIMREGNKGGVGIYHCVYRHEDFSTAALMIFKMLQEAQNQFPNQSRYLYLDIEGHRNARGGFDRDMDELQKEFLIGFLGKYFVAIHIPYMSVENKDTQDNDIPVQLTLHESFL